MKNQWKSIINALAKVWLMVLRTIMREKLLPLPPATEPEPTTSDPPSQRLNAKGDVDATSGLNSSVQSSNSQVLSLLQLDSLHSTRRIERIVIHCSDTRPSQCFTLETLKACHKKRGFGNYPGYHFYIRRNGLLHYCRPIKMRGCHVKGHNSTSIGICYEGGHRDEPSPVPSRGGRGVDGGSVYEDNRTAEQMVTLHELLTVLHQIYPAAKIVGHHDLCASKVCPCFDAAHEYEYIMRGA